MKNTMLKLALLVISLPLLTACDHEGNDMVHPVNGLNEPLVKLEFFQTGAVNFEYVIEKQGTIYRLSLLEDGSLHYPPNTVYFNIGSSHPSYGILNSIFAGTTTLERYVDPCPACPKGAWSGFFATLKKDGSEVQVDLDAATRLKVDALVNEIYLVFAPPVDEYFLIDRYCMSGAQVNDAFNPATDSLSIDFYSSNHFNVFQSIGGVNTAFNHLYAWNGTTMIIDGGLDSMEVYAEPGIYPTRRLTLTSSAFVGSGGSCPAGDHLVLLFE